ncbi:MAG: lipoprotein [Syntrophaceae bacterium]|nr:MAG: lipoprotein [Syntrophaceae bacterium]
MKVRIFAVLVGMLSIVLAGCGASGVAVKQPAPGDKGAVFREIKADEKPAGENAVLVIEASIKTHQDGYYLLESSQSRHGKESYPFQYSIDGQTVVWDVAGVKDSQPAYDAQGKTSRNPEARDGMKYILEKRITLKTGSHRICFSLPEEAYSTTVDIRVEEGRENRVEFKPVYRQKDFPVRIPTFLKGVERYEVFMNGYKMSLVREDRDGRTDGVPVVVPTA